MAFLSSLRSFLLLLALQWCYEVKIFFCLLNLVVFFFSLIVCFSHRYRQNTTVRNGSFDSQLFLERTLFLLPCPDVCNQPFSVLLSFLSPLNVTLNSQLSYLCFPQLFVPLLPLLLNCSGKQDSLAWAIALPSFQTLLPLGLATQAGGAAGAKRFSRVCKAPESSELALKPGRRGTALFSWKGEGRGRESVKLLLIVPHLITKVNPTRLRTRALQALYCTYQHSHFHLTALDREAGGGEEWISDFLENGKQTNKYLISRSAWEYKSRVLLRSPATQLEIRIYWSVLSLIFTGSH